MTNRQCNLYSTFNNIDLQISKCGLPYYSLTYSILCLSELSLVFALLNTHLILTISINDLHLTGLLIQMSYLENYRAVPR